MICNLITEGVDYKEVPQNISIPSNLDNFKFNITILDDCSCEPNETFGVEIVTIINTDHNFYLVRLLQYNRTANVTIIDDDDDRLSE